MVQFRLGDDIEVTCKQDVADRLAAVGLKTLPLPEAMMDRAWPANDMEEGGALRVVGLVEVIIPDTAEGIPFRIKVPLRNCGTVRRARLMVPSGNGLSEAREKLRLRSDRGMTFALFTPEASGVYAIVEKKYDREVRNPVNLLAPDGWTFQKVQWRSITQYLTTPIGQSPHVVEVEPERMTEQYLVNLTFRDDRGEEHATGWRHFSDLPFRAVLFLMPGSFRQFDADFFASSPFTPSSK